jgi:transcriptional regulator of heat shock response
VLILEKMLSSREQQILRAIVHEYASSAQPVGSRVLWARYGLGISPATIRTVMSALTEAGFLAQPHTSAGRVPTERAYRLFLEGTEVSTPSVGEQEKIRLRTARAADSRTAMLTLAQLLGEISAAAAVYLDDAGTHTYHLSNVFGTTEFSDPRVAAYLAELFDHSDEWLPRLADKPGQIAIRIGQENEDFRARHISVVAMQLKAGKQRGYVAVIGPTRLPYRKLTALLEYTREELTKQYGKA